MTAAEIVDQLRSLGQASYRKVLLNHGIVEPVFGVKVDELKKIQKRVGKNYALALELYETRIYDAQYLAGLMVDDKQMTKKDLKNWLATSNGTAICGTTVAWVAAESRYGNELAAEWIESAKENTAQVGWRTLAGLVSIQDDSALDIPALKRLLQRVEKTIHHAPNLVRYATNGFVIAVGTYVRELSDLAMQTAKNIGPVSVDMGKTACKVPFAPDYIEKARARNVVGKKRKTTKC